MKKIFVKKILLIITVILITYITIECIRGTIGRTPLIIINEEKIITPIREDTETLNVFDKLKDNSKIVTEVSHGLVFTSYKSYNAGSSTGWVSRTNKLFDIITIWKMEAN